MDAREKILEVATRLFSTQGYGSTSLSQVARSAEVSKALIFWHFETKERLFQAALERSLEPYFINVMEELEGADELEQVLRLIDLYAAFVNEHGESVRFVMSLILRDEPQPENAVSRIAELFRVFRTLFSDVLEAGRKEGTVAAAVEPAAEAALILAVLNGALVQGYLGSELGEAAPVIQHLKTTLSERLEP